MTSGQPHLAFLLLWEVLHQQITTAEGRGYRLSCIEFEQELRRLVDKDSN